MVFFSALVFISFLLFRNFRYLSKYFGLIDVPNERSSHSEPVIRGAGIVFCFAWFASIFLKLGFQPILLMSLVGVLGFCDDWRGLSAPIRFMIQGVVLACFLVLSPFQDAYLWFLFPLILFLGLWSINLFNFMDGINGLAASEGLIVLGFYTLLARETQDLWFISLSGFCSLLPFLWFNFPHAKLFMGDGGSGFLGALIFALFYLGFLQGMNLHALLISYSFFWFDSTSTLLRRMFSGEKWYEGHRKHAYQKLHHKARWPHHRVVFLSWAMNALLCLTAWNVHTQNFAPFLAWVLTFVLLVGYGYFVEKTTQR